MSPTNDCGSIGQSLSPLSKGAGFTFFKSEIRIRGLFSIHSQIMYHVTRWGDKKDSQRNYCICSMDSLNQPTVVWRFPSVVYSLSKLTAVLINTYLLVDLLV